MKLVTAKTSLKESKLFLLAIRGTKRGYVTFYVFCKDTNSLDIRCKPSLLSVFFLYTGKFMSLSGLERQTQVWAKYNILHLGIANCHMIDSWQETAPVGIKCPANSVYAEPSGV